MKKIILSLISIFFTATAAAAPQQLNIEGFASCLAQELPQPDYLKSVLRNILYPGDMLLSYLAVYSGRRLPVVGAVSQARWSDNYAKEELSLANSLYQLAQAPADLMPNVIYREALKSCGSKDAFCASLISHNVLRTLGRSSTAFRFNPLTQEMEDLNPKWFKSERQTWLSRSKKIQRSMISLHRDGSDDRWGDNYHFFGLLTYAFHEKSIYNTMSTARIAARLNQVLNPLLAGGPEGVEKARIDRDSVEVATKYFEKLYKSSAWNCKSSAAYRLAP